MTKRLFSLVVPALGLLATACAPAGDSARIAARIVSGEAPERVIFEEKSDSAALLRATRRLVDNPRERAEFLAELRVELERLEEE
jgi:hypothetical protein